MCLQQLFFLQLSTFFYVQNTQVAGSSDKPCADNFAGVRPFFKFFFIQTNYYIFKFTGPAPDSEKETQGIRNAINAKLGMKYDI